MIRAGDEVGATQQGNNNAYCQDNEISWMDWRLGETNSGLLRFFQLMIGFRKHCPLLRRQSFRTERPGWLPYLVARREAREARLERRIAHACHAAHATPRWLTRRPALYCQCLYRRSRFRVAPHRRARMVSPGRYRATLTTRHRRRRPGVPAPVAGKLFGAVPQRGSIRREIGTCRRSPTMWDYAITKMTVPSPTVPLQCCSPRSVDPHRPRLNSPPPDLSSRAPRSAAEGPLSPPTLSTVLSRPDPPQPPSSRFVIPSEAKRSRGTPIAPNTLHPVIAHRNLLQRSSSRFVIPSNGPAGQVETRMTRSNVCC